MIKTYISYKEIAGREASVARILKILSAYRIVDVLGLISILNASAAVQDYEGLQRGYIHLLFEPEMRAKILKAMGIGRPVIARQQLLVLLKLALLSCDVDFPFDQIPPAFNWEDVSPKTIGEAILQSGDIAGLSVLDRDNKDDLHIALTVLPTMELNQGLHPTESFGRARRLWLEIPESPQMKKSENYVPIGERFKDYYGVSLWSYIHVLFTMMARIEQFHPLKAGENGPIVIDENKYLSKSHIAMQDVRAALHDISKPYRWFTERLLASSSHSFVHDFTLFQRTPLIEIFPRQHLVFDRVMLYQFASDGIYGRVLQCLEASDASEASRFETFFGDIFEEYVSGLFQHVFSSPPRSNDHFATYSPMFSKSTAVDRSHRNDQVSDVLIEIEDPVVKSIIVVEVKASMLSPQAKYSGDLNAFKKQLIPKFIGQGKNIKGVTQLANSIAKLLNGQTTSALRYDITEYQTIYPILLVFDDAIAGLGMAYPLQQIFAAKLKELTDKPTRQVKELTAMTVEDFEIYTSAGRKEKLHYLLAQYRNNPDRTASFGDFLKARFYRELELKDSTVWSSMDGMFEEAIEIMEAQLEKAASKAAKGSGKVPSGAQRARPKKFRGR